MAPTQGGARGTGESDHRPRVIASRELRWLHRVVDPRQRHLDLDVIVRNDRAHTSPLALEPDHVLIGERVQVVVNVPDSLPVVRCVHCEASGSIGSVDPFTKCPDRGDGAPDTDVETVPAP